MNVVNFYGDNRLRHRIVYSKNSYTECIYCGEEADSREHIPSRVFLTQPFPNNLSTVPACKKCNNSYSEDELFVSLLIQLLKKKHFGSEYNFSQEVQSRMEKNKTIVAEIKDAIEKDNILNFHPKLFNVLTKLAIGHAVYEVSEGYYTGTDGITIDSCILDYEFLNNITQENLEEFYKYYIINNEVISEFGSRVYERVLVLENDLGEQYLFLDWVEVQKSEYIYTCYKFYQENKIIVKMAISNFMLIEVVLLEKN